MGSRVRRRLWSRAARRRAIEIPVISVVERAVVSTVERLESRRLLALAPAGGEFLVNTTTGDAQAGAATAMDADGDFMVAWHSWFNDGNNWGVYAQRYSAAGAAQGGEFRVNTYTTGNQALPAVAMNALGDSVVTWASEQDGSSYGIYAQRYNAAGVPQGVEFRVNTFTTSHQTEPSIAMDVAGNFVIGWHSNGQDGSLNGIYARRYNAAGVALGSEFRVNTYTTSSQYGTSVALDADGDFVIAWHSLNQDGNSYGIYAQRYNALGVAQGGEFQVNNTTTGNQHAPAVAMDLAGNFLVSWGSPDGSNYGVFARRYNAAGVAQGTEFLVNTYTTNHQRRPAAAMDANGDFVVSWHSTGQDGSGDGVYARSYDAAGAAQGTEFRVNTYTTNTQQLPAIGMNAAGDFVVAWQSDNAQDGSGGGVYAQRYDESADIAGPIIGGVFVGGSRVQPHGVVGGPVSQIVVGFAEAAYNFGGPSNVTSPANWRVTHHDGTTTSDVPISEISYFFNAAARRFEATLTLSSPVTAGNLQVIALDTLRDPAGNALDGNLDGSAGGSASLAFSIGGYVRRDGEFQVNTYAPNNQHRQEIATDHDGDFVVTWESYGQDGSGWGVYAQRYNAAGVPQGSEFRVNTYTTNNQSDPAIAMNADGDFVVAWESYLQDDLDFGIYAQRYDAAGIAQGSEFRVNNYSTLGYQRAPAIAMDADGNFVVVWQSVQEGGFAYDIYARRYNAAGAAQGSEFLIQSDVAGNQNNPAIGMDAGGNFAVTWESSFWEGDSNGVYARRYDASGVAQGTEFHVNSFTMGDQASPAIGMSATGDFVVAWSSDIQDGSSTGIYAQRYNASGAAQGSEFRVNSFTTGSQLRTAIGIDATGNFVITWDSNGQDGSGYGVYARRYNATGVAQGSEFRVNTLTTDFQSSPAVAVDADGDFVIVWRSDNQDGSGFGVYGQRYTLALTPTVGLLSDSPDLPTVGTPFTLTASSITDDMFAARVLFYREANGIAGLQFGIDGDTPLGADNVGGDGWSTIVSTSSLVPGTYTYYAQATDNTGLIGAPASTTNTVAMAVLSSAFQFEVLQQKLSFGFDADAALAGLGVEDISLQKVGGGAVPAVTMLPYGTDGTNVASFTLNTQLADGNYIATISAAGVSGGGQAMASNHTFDFFILGGDANHDRRVDVLDLVSLAINWQGTGKTWSQADFNYDGVINKADLGVMALAWHQTLAQPAPPLAGAPVTTSSRAPARPGVRTPVRTPTISQDILS